MPVLHYLIMTDFKIYNFLKRKQKVHNFFVFKMRYFYEHPLHSCVILTNEAKRYIKEAHFKKNQFFMTMGNCTC